MDLVFEVKSYILCVARVVQKFFVQLLLFVQHFVRETFKNYIYWKFNLKNNGFIFILDVTCTSLFDNIFVIIC